MFTTEHIYAFFAGATGFAIIAHGVSTFPTPKNAYGQWLLGVIKFAVGQRITATNAFNGMQSEVTAVTTAQKSALEQGSTMLVVKDPSTKVLVPTD